MPATMTGGEWPQLIRDFSRRNAGRPTRLELDDGEMGAQWSELDLHFSGAAYEPRFRRVEVMLADGGLTEHLTHSVEGVTDLRVLRGRDGRDEVLRIGYPGGQALVVLGDV